MTQVRLPTPLKAFERILVWRLVTSGMRLPLEVLFKTIPISNFGTPPLCRMLVTHSAMYLRRMTLTAALMDQAYWTLLEQSN